MESCNLRITIKSHGSSAIFAHLATHNTLEDNETKVKKRKHVAPLQISFTGLSFPEEGQFFPKRPHADDQ
jgi:hypothetical protein